VLIASAALREIWRVGNSTFTVAGEWFPQPWVLSEVPARMRATYLKALLREGSTSVEHVRREDPGSALIAPLLRVEHVFRNAVDVGDLAYAAIDGREVPRELIERVAIPAGAEVVFASDGYPRIKPTLAETEAYLKQSLAEDPLRIGRHPEVRGVAAGRESYDDRAYLRFSLAE
jgi:hypothetical protein